MGKLLLDEYPLIILPELATKVGLNEAVVLQQIHYWLRTFEQGQDEKHFRDGAWWVYNTVAGWRDQFPFWSYNTIKRTLAALRKPYAPKVKGQRVERGALIITTSKYNRAGFDNTLWYTIDYAALDNMGYALAQNGPTGGPKWAGGMAQNGPVEKAKMGHTIPETSRDKATDNTTETAAAGLSQEQEKRPVICSIHGVEMGRHEKGGDTWYSHRLADGSWCKGGAGDTGKVEDRARQSEANRFRYMEWGNGGGR